MFVIVSDVQPVLGADRLGGNVLSHFLSVGLELQVRTVICYLTRTRRATSSRSLCNHSGLGEQTSRGKFGLTHQPVDTVSIDLRKNKRDIVIQVRLSMKDCLD